MNKEKKILLVSLFIFLILVIVSLTYAFFTWKGTDTTLTSYAECFDILYDKGADIGSDQEAEILMPSTDYTGGLSATVKMGIDEACSLVSAKGRLYLNTLDTTSDSLFDNGELNYMVLKNGVETGITGIIDEPGSIELNIGVLSKYDSVESADSYTVYVWLNEEFITNDDIGAMYYGEISAEALQYEDLPTAAEYITNLYTTASKSTVINNNITYNTAPSVGLMNDRLGGTTESLDGGNIRYYGANPNNYVSFGETYTWQTIGSEMGIRFLGNAFSSENECLNAIDYVANCSQSYSLLGFSDISSCESNISYVMNKTFGTSNLSELKSNYCSTRIDSLYRIIGVFNGKLKVIANESIGAYSWDTSEQSVNNGAGVNEWSQSDLMKLLNPGYTNENVDNSLYWTNSSGICYNNQNNETISCSFKTDELSEKIKNMISEETWYLGGHAGSPMVFFNTVYMEERSSNVMSAPSDGIPRTTTWRGKVALPYLSDYVCAVNYDLCEYSTLENPDFDVCKTNNWLGTDLNYWFLTPANNNSVWYSHSNGYFIDENVYMALGVRPTFYLKSTVSIISGTGTEQDPYIIG